MKRREFLQALGALGVTAIAPDIFTDKSFLSRAHAAPGISSTTVNVPTITPQVINIFLYGGASELAGNLTNIIDINTQSQSKYTELNPNFLNAYDPINATPNDLAQGNVGQVTPNAFWAHAGGIVMEDMLLSGDMTVYRTCNRKKNNTRAHRPSIFSTQKGTLDIDNAPGIGSTLAGVFAEHRAAYETAFGLTAEGRTLEELVMPMVSFEGESTIFAPDPNATTQIPLALKSVGLSANFDNPYQRGSEPASAATLNALVDTRMKAEPLNPDSDELTDDYGKRYRKVSESFLNHRKLAVLVNNFRTIQDDPDALPLLPEGDPDGSFPEFSTALYTAYQAAVGGSGRNFYHTASATDTPVPWPTPPGPGLDNTWVEITTTDAMGVTTTTLESRFVAFDGTVILDPDTDPRINADDPNAPNRLVYPQNNRFAELLQAAVTLAIYNKDTKFIMVGSPGLGGWDDHNSALMSYEARMQTLMSAVRAAVKHIKYSFDGNAGQSFNPMAAEYRNGQSTDNIIINISTDFGRNANLNNSKGWDHGNQQNFYTFGGRPFVRDANAVDELGNPITVPDRQPVQNVDTYYGMRTDTRANMLTDIGAIPELTASPAVRPPGALGKIVGTTSIFGTPGANRWFTEPSNPSNLATTYNQNSYPGGTGIPTYEFEPQAIASTVYSWFGVTNPEILTKNDNGDFATGTINRYASDGAGNLQGTESSHNVADGEPPIDENLPSVHTNTPLPVKNIVT